MKKLLENIKQTLRAREFKNMDKIAYSIVCSMLNKAGIDVWDNRQVMQGLHLELRKSVSVDAIIVSGDYRVNQFAIQVIDYSEMIENLNAYLELADLYSGMRRTKLWIITDGNNWIANNSETKEQNKIEIFVDKNQYIVEFMDTYLR